MDLETADTNNILIPVMKAQGMTAIGTYVKNDPNYNAYFGEVIGQVYYDWIGESSEDRSIGCYFDLNTSVD